MLKCFLEHRYFHVKFSDELTEMHPFKSEVGQGSVLGPVHYNLFIADLPVTTKATVATFADDTVILAVHENPAIASQ